MMNVVYTKRCSDGTACASPTDTDWRAYIPDDVEICDYCLLSRFGLTSSRTDGCGDPLGMFPLYDEHDVVKALRQAGGL